MNARIQQVTNLYAAMMASKDEGAKVKSQRQEITAVIYDAVTTNDLEALAYFSQEIKKKKEDGTEGALFNARMCFTVASFLGQEVLTGKWTLTSEAFSTQYTKRKAELETIAKKEAEAIGALMAQTIEANQAIESYLANKGETRTVAEFMAGTSAGEQALAMTEGKALIDAENAEAEAEARKEALSQALIQMKEVFNTLESEAPDLALDFVDYVLTSQAATRKAA